MSQQPITASTTAHQLPRVAVLLSVYNGEKFLGQQLESLLAQTYTNFIIVIRDDGSKDGSYDLVSQYARQAPEKFHILPIDNRNYGASGGFSFLTQYALTHRSELGLTQAYLMYCDQDDRWFENKISLQMDALLNAEREQQIPLLVHSDLEVVSEAGESIAPSLAVYQGLETQRNRFANLAISNLVTGCTALINQDLAEKCLPVPDEAIMHDWWMALTAAAFGKIIFLDKPLVHYRQHQNNTIGAKEFVQETPISRTFWQKLFSLKANPHLIEVGVQAAAFRKRFKGELNFKQRLALVFCTGMQVQVAFIQRVFYRIARRF